MFMTMANPALQQAQFWAVGKGTTEHMQRQVNIHESLAWLG